MKSSGIYYDESGIMLPLAEVPIDDIRKYSEIKTVEPETLVEKEFKQEYQKLLNGNKYPLRHNEPWDDVEIQEIIQEEDTLENRLMFAVIFDRTPDAIGFIQGYAKRETPTKVWMDFHYTYLQTKRCQVKLRQITKKDYEEIEALCKRVHDILHGKSEEGKK